MSTNRRINLIKFVTTLAYIYPKLSTSFLGIGPGCIYEETRRWFTPPGVRVSPAIVSDFTHLLPGSMSRVSRGTPSMAPGDPRAIKPGECWVSPSRYILYFSHPSILYSTLQGGVHLYRV